MVRFAKLGLAAVFLLVGCASAPDPEFLPYLVFDVVDGDTITVEDPWGLRTRVRLRDTDAPELDEPGGREAKAALEEELQGRRVRMISYARDRYGRLIATVHLP